MRRTPGEDNPVISLAIAFEMDSFLDKYSKIFIVFGEHRSFISVHLIVTLSLLIVTLSLLIAIDFFCILAPGYCAEDNIGSSSMLGMKSTGSSQNFRNSRS